MEKIELNQNWQVRYAPLYYGFNEADEIRENPKSDFLSNWMPTELPSDVHSPLIKEGIILEPLEGLNSFDSEWIEEKSWWYRKVFSLEKAFLENDRVELFLDYLDAQTQILLNGHCIGVHKSVHFPFERDVLPWLKEGDNELLIRITTGSEDITSGMTAPYKNTVNKTYRRGDERRVFLRKPQYVFGWDWSPRVVTCGIAGSAFLTGYRLLAVRNLKAVTKKVTLGQPDTALVELEAEIENLDPIRTVESEIELSLSFGEKKEINEHKSMLLRSGLNYVSFTISLKEARLWWPNGMGEQNLYEALVSVKAEKQEIQAEPLIFGVRTLSLDLSDIGGGGHLFAIEVNQKRVFCKGGNWIPPDALYARVTEDKYKALIAEAKEANFTMLRIWGGGIYEKDIFYRLCDMHGLLVWQDIMFACASYPDIEENFNALVSLEMDYQLKRLRNHPCLALLCGNNENQWIFLNEWNASTQFNRGHLFYDRMAPEKVRLYADHIPYWNSSPYGGEEPNSNEVGDRHHWHDCTMNPDMEKRITPEEYDKVESKFVSEYGYIGPCSFSTIRDYHAGASIYQGSEVWDWHNNTFEKDTVLAGIHKHYTVKELSLKEYLLYAGICQGMMYSYSLEAIRFKKTTWGSLFWMYNDCWGEVGWTIIDYYLDRKPSYYYVKRAFKPRKLILRVIEQMVEIIGVNETPEAISFPIEYGYISFDGNKKNLMEKEINLPAFSRDLVFTFPLPSEDLLHGIVYIRPLVSDGPDTAFYRFSEFKNLAVKKPHLKLDSFERNQDGSVWVTITSDIYAHAVHFEDNEGNILDRGWRFSDNFFDLLPNEVRRISINGPEEKVNKENLTLASVYNE